jgi:4-amino-4-deoxy-L-arabinose transferase-like glycosyltransferase
MRFAWGARTLRRRQSTAIDMSTTERTPASTTSHTRVGVFAVEAPRSPRLLLVYSGAQRVALAGILALSAVLNTHRLAQNGYANTFYSAGVRAMLRSWHNFLFVSFDPGGLVTIDKPPLGVWVQAASAELFGFSPLSLLLPEAILSTLAVAVLFRMLARRLGAGAGLAGALALAVFPSFVAVSRDNGVDPLLILLMLLACGAALNAIEDGRWRWLLGCAVLVGLAFNTKTLAAYLIVPGIALAYLLCAPGSWLRRTGMLLVAGLVMGICSFSWIAVVELTPASQRPFVGSSTDNSELGLTFSYNGFGRVEGELGGPGEVPHAEGARLPAAHRRSARPLAAPPARRHAPPPHRFPGVGAAGPGAREPIVRVPALVLPNGRLRNPITFGGATGPLRLFESRLADQGAWMLPFALLGLLALGLLLLASDRTSRDPSVAAEPAHRDPSLAGQSARRDPRLAVLIVLGVWLLAEVAILSFSKGIVHPYYISALGPGVAAMVGAGALAFTRFAQWRDPRAVLLVVAVIATVLAQREILDFQHYMGWFLPLLAIGPLVCIAAMAVRRLAAPAMGLLLCLLLVAPAAYASTTWLAHVQGTFPAAGPHQATGSGEFGVNSKAMRVDRNLIAYVSTHRPGTRWAVLTDAAPTAAPLMLLGLSAGAMAGYSGTDPALDGPALARLVAHGWARYVVLGGAYASRGGNLATKATLRACREVPSASWHGPKPSPYQLVLFDCAGRERVLSAPVRS